jgi:hypothetical protein
MASHCQVAATLLTSSLETAYDTIGVLNMDQQASNPPIDLQSVGGLAPVPVSEGQNYPSPSHHPMLPASMV